MNKYDELYELAKKAPFTFAYRLEIGSWRSPFMWMRSEIDWRKGEITFEKDDDEVVYDSFTAKGMPQKVFEKFLYISDTPTAMLRDTGRQVMAKLGNPRMTLALSSTTNLGNFNSAKGDLGLSADVIADEDESFDDAFEDAFQQMFDKVSGKVRNMRRSVVERVFGKGSQG